MQDYKQFLELIQPQPGFKILDVTAHADGLTQALLNHLSGFDDARLDVAMYPGEHQKFEASETLVLQTLPHYKAPFRALPRNNDIVIIRDVLLQHEMTERILKSIYTTLANAGNIIIVMEKASAEVAYVKDLLDRFEFRAPNEIDLLDGYAVITAKKMHMWGNGL